MATKSTPTRAPAPASKAAPVAKASAPVIVTPRMQADAVAAARGQAVANRLSSPEYTNVVRPVEQGSSSQANGVIGYNQGGGAIYGNSSQASANNSLNYAPSQIISNYQASATAPTIPNAIDSNIMATTGMPKVPTTSTYDPARMNLNSLLGSTPQYQDPNQVQGQTKTQGNTKGTPQVPAVNNQGINFAENKINGLYGQLQAPQDDLYTLQGYQSLTNKVAQEDATRAQLQIDQGIAQKTAELNKFGLQEIQDQQAFEQEKQRIQSNPQGKFGGAIQQDLNRLEQDYTNKRISNGIVKALAQNDLQMANNIIDQTLNSMYSTSKKQLEYYKQGYEMSKNDMSESQKLAYQAQIKQKELETKALEPQSVTEKYGTGAIGEYNFAKSQGYKGTFNAYQNEDANRKKSIARAGVSNGSGYTPAQINSTVNSIAGSFDNEPIVKNFNIQSEGYQFANSIPSNAKNPSDHQGLVYAFAKAMDPGSVVREGEYATVQKYAQSWAKAYGKGFEQAALGTGFLSSTAIDNIKKTIKSRYDVAEKQYKSLNSEYNSRIDKAKKGQGNSLTNYGTAFSAPSSKASSGSSYKDYQNLIK